MNIITRIKRINEHILTKDQSNSLFDWYVNDIVNNGIKVKINSDNTNIKQKLNSVFETCSINLKECVENLILYGNHFERLTVTPNGVIGSSSMGGVGISRTNGLVGVVFKVRIPNSDSEIIFDGHEVLHFRVNVDEAQYGLLGYSIDEFDQFTIQKIKDAIVSELNKLFVIHLYALGYRESELTNYSVTI